MTSLLSALAIQNNEVLAYAGQDPQTKKWGWEISYTEARKFRPIVSHAAIYDTEEQAKKEADSYVSNIKALDLSGSINDITSRLGEDEMKVIGEIVSAAQNR